MARSLMAAPLSISRSRSASTSALSLRSSFFSSWKRRAWLGLAGQVADLLVHFIAQILQALHVLARAADPCLGLAPPLLVTRDAGRFFHEGAHVVAARLDDAGNHALFDDGVAARAQARAQEQRGDVLAAAARAIDEIAPRRHRATPRASGKSRCNWRNVPPILPSLLSNTSSTEAVPTGRRPPGTVEDHVGHGVAAQMPRRQLAHHPAHGVDDVGLAAAIGAHHPGEIVGNGTLVGSTKDLKPASFTLVRRIGTTESGRTKEVA